MSFGKLTIDSQESYSNGVLVLVTGSLSFQGSGTRMFTQSFFFLAPQDKVFYVLNDVLRYMDEEREQPKQDLELEKGLAEKESTVSLPETAPVVEPESATENGQIDESLVVEQESTAEEEIQSTEEAQISEVPVVEIETVTEQQTQPVNNEVKLCTHFLLPSAWRSTQYVARQVGWRGRGLRAQVSDHVLPFGEYAQAEGQATQA